MQSDVHSLRYASYERHGEVDADNRVQFGFWIYIMTDVVLFAALFATYAVLGRNTAGGPTAHDLFDLKSTLTETIFLLLSSISYGFAMISMHKNSRNATAYWLVITALLGLGFLFMEFHEFHSMIVEGFGPQRSGFLSAFFTLVGTHGAHVSIGIIWMVIMLEQLAKKGLNFNVRSRLMRLGLFWHFLDIVWIGVFSVVYLMGVAV